MAAASGSEHKYLRIADALRRAIADGTYRPGDRLPGESTLAQEHQVAVMTVRQAIGVLRQDGLVTSRKGSGVYVDDFTPVRRHGIKRVSKEGWGAGRSVWATDENRPVTIDQITVEETEAPATIATVLALDPGETTCRRSRRYVVDGRPVMLADSYLNFGLVAGSAITQPDTGPGGIYARLAELGRGPVRFVEEIRGRMPTTQEAERLGLAPGRSVLKIVRTAYDEEGRAVEVNEMTADTASYVLEYAFDA